MMMAEDDILERNIEQLLTRAHDPPRMRPEARSRVLANLKAERRPAASDEPAESYKPAESDEPETPVAPTPIRPHARRKTRVAVVIGLTLAAMLALVWALGSFDGRLTSEPAEGTRIANSSAGPMSIELDDGSVAILRGGAAIDTLSPREIRLVEGELLVDVAKDDTPFVVHTSYGRAVALGTRFSVRSELDRALTAVVRGTVRIENDGGQALLSAGEAGIITSEGAPQKTLAERMSHTLAWAKAQMSTLDGEARPPVRRGNLIARDQWSGKDWPLPLRTLIVDVHVEDGIARTTIDQTFFNHIGRQLEGVYSFPLPSDAAISRLAMYVDGTLMEGGIVERDRGRNVYESIVYQRRDPALLEWMKGNEFRVRIFPLPARTEKRILLSYTQPLRSSYGAYQLDVPIPQIDLPVDTVDVRVHVKGTELDIESDSHRLEAAGTGEATYHGEAVELGDDLRLTLRPRAEQPARTIEFRDDSGAYVMARARPELRGEPRHTPRSWVVLYDTSASRSPELLEAQSILARRFVQQMDEDDRVAFLAFDTETRAMPGGFVRVDDLDGDALGVFLRTQAQIAAGVTDLALGLDTAVTMLADESREPHILYLGDGLVTEGDDDLSLLRDRVAGKATVVAIATGDGDDRTLSALADASGGLAATIRPGDDLGWRAFEVLSILNGPRLVDVSATLLDADGRALEGLDALVSSQALAHGDGVSVLARADAKADVPVARVKIEGLLDGAPWSQTIELVAESREAAYLPRLWAQARIDAWLDDDAEGHRDDIAELGMRHFLITPHTSLLVLENEAMYKQYKVTRPDADDWAHYPAPGTIPVVVEPMGRDPLGVYAATDLILRDPLQIIASPRATGLMLDGLGLRGTGRGGGGSGGTILDLMSAESGHFLASPYGAAFAVGDDDEDVWGGLVDMEVGAPARAPGPEQREQQQQTAVIRGTRSTGSTIDYRRSALKSTETISRVVPDQAKRRYAAHDGNTWWSGPSVRTRGWGGLYYGYGSSSVPLPQSLHYSHDNRLDDITNFVPGMFADSYDYARERVLADAVDIEHGSITDDARARVQAARAALRPTRYRLPGGDPLSVDADGRFWLTRTTTESLEEQVVYDGEHSYALYPELGLGVRRRIGSTAPLLLLRQVPWVMPEPEHLARWFDVTAVGERGLHLSPVGRDEGGLDIELDAEDRIVAIVRGEVTTRLSYTSSGITITHGDTRTELVNAGAAGTVPSVDEGAWTLVDLPLHPDKYWQDREGEHAVGSAEWRQALRQRLATAVATDGFGSMAPLARDLLSAGLEPTPGELVLLSSAVRFMNRDELDDLLTAAPAPLADYLRTTHGWLAKSASRPWAGVARRHPDGLLGTLASYRGALWDAERSKSAPALRFVDRNGDSQLAYVLVHRAAQMVQWRRPGDAVKLWDALSSHEPWLSVAHHSAGIALSNRGQYGDAADRFEQSIDAALDADRPPIFDWYVQQAMVAGRGQAGYDLMWSRFRTAATSGALPMRMAFITAATQLGAAPDAHRVIATIRPEHLQDVPLAVSLVDQLINAANYDDAWVITRRLLSDRASSDPAVLDRASVISEKQGRLADAAGYLEQAMEADANEPTTLDELRADFRRLVGLHSRLAATPLDTEQAGEHRREALDAAARWRHEDPDNSEIDILCASLYVDEPEQAWRQLSGIIERRPAEGDAYAQVARALEREGQLERADTVWERAIKVEPTNPTWSLRRAQNLAALGDSVTARTLLDAVREGEWQPRFAGIVSEARQLRRHLRTK